MRIQTAFRRHLLPWAGPLLVADIHGELVLFPYVLIQEHVFFWTLESFACQLMTFTEYASLINLRKKCMQPPGLAHEVHQIFPDFRANYEVAFMFIARAHLDQRGRLSWRYAPGLRMDYAQQDVRLSRILEGPQNTQNRTWGAWP